MASLPSTLLKLVVAVVPLLAVGLLLALGPQEVVHWGSLTVDPAQLDFGDVWESSAFPWSLTIKNNSHVDVPVDHISTSCGCVTVVDPQSFVVPAHASREIRVVLDLIPAFDPGESATSRSFATTIVPVTGGEQLGGDSARGWTIRGTVKQVFKDLPRSHRINELVVRGLPGSVQSIIVRLAKPLERLDAKMPRQFGRATATKVRDDQWSVGFELDAQPKSGPMPFDLTLAGYNGGVEIAVAVVKVHATVEEVVQAVPTVLQMGPLTIGQTAVSEVKFHSHVKRSFVLDGHDKPDTGIVVVPDGDHGCKLTVKAAVPGSVSTTVSFYAKVEGGSERVRIPVRVQYYGVDEK